MFKKLNITLLKTDIYVQSLSTNTLQYKIGKLIQTYLKILLIYDSGQFWTAFQIQSWKFKRSLLFYYDVIIQSQVISHMIK